MMKIVCPKIWGKKQNVNLFIILKLSIFNYETFIKMINLNISFIKKVKE